MPKLRFLTKGFCLAIAVVSVATAKGADPPYYEVTYQPSTKEGQLQIGVTHTLWIPANVETVRGIIIHQHGCGVGACRSGETAAYDLHWQALARKWDCALLGPSYKQAKEQNCRLWCDPRNGSGKVLLESLAKLAKVSGHSEIASGRDAFLALGIQMEKMILPTMAIAMVSRG